MSRREQQYVRQLTTLLHNSYSNTDLRFPGTADSLTAVINNNRLSQVDLRPSSAITNLSKVRLVVPEYQTQYESNQIVKHAVHAFPNIHQKSANQHLEFNYQKEYEKLLTKYKKNRRLIKDLSNQIIVKDSIISNFELEISACKSATDVSLFSENDDIKTKMTESQRQLSFLHIRFSNLEQQKVRNQSQHKNTISSLKKDLAVSNRRIEDLQKSFSLTSQSSQNFNRDREYYTSRINETEKIIKLKDIRITQLQSEMFKLSNQLNQTCNQLDMSKHRSSDRQQTGYYEMQMQMQMRDIKIKQFEKDINLLSNQIKEMNKTMVQTQSQKLKLMRQLNQMKLKQQHTNQLINTKNDQIEKIKLKDEKIIKLQSQINQIHRKLHDTTIASKKQFQTLIWQKDTKITELQSEITKINWQIKETKKQIQLHKIHYKSKEQQLQKQMSQEITLRETRIQSLKKQMAIQKSNYSNLLMQQSKNLEQIHISSSKSLDEVKTQNLEQLRRHQTQITDLQRQIRQNSQSSQSKGLQLAYKRQQSQKTVKQKEQKIAELADILKSVQKTRMQNLQQIYKHQQQILDLQKQLRQATQNTESITLKLNYKIQQYEKSQKVKDDTIVRLELQLSNVIKQSEQIRNQNLQQIRKHQVQITELQKSLRQVSQNAQSSTLKLSYKMQQAQKSIKQKEDKITYLEIQLTQFNKQVEQIKSASQSKINKLTSAIDQLSQQNSRKLFQITSLQQQLKISQANFDSLSQNSKQQTNLMDNVQQKFNRQKQIFYKQLLENQNTIKQLENSLNEHKLLEKEINNQIKLKQTLATDLTKQLENIKQYYQSLNQNNLSEIDDLNRILSEAHSRLQQTSRQCILTQSTLNQMDKQLKASYNQSILLKKLFKDKDEAIQLISTKLTQIDKQNTSQKGKIQQLTSQLQYQRKEHNHLKQIHSSQRDSHQAEISRLSNILLQHQNNISIMTVNHKTEIYVLQSAIKGNSTKVSQLECEIQHMKHQDIISQQKLQNLQNENTKQKDHAHELRKDFAGKLQSTEKQNIETIMQLQNEITQLNIRLTDADGEMSGIRNLLVEKDRELDTKSLRLTQLEIEIDQLRKNILGLNINSIEAAKASENVSVKLQKDTLQQLSKLRQQLSDSETMIALKDRQLKIKDQQIFVFQQKLKQTQEAYCKIRFLQSELQQLKVSQQVHQNQSEKTLQIITSHHNKLEKQQKIQKTHHTNPERSSNNGTGINQLNKGQIQNTDVQKDLQIYQLKSQVSQLRQQLVNASKKTELLVDATSISFATQPSPQRRSINYEQKYHTLLKSLDLHLTDSEQTINKRVQILISIHQRYDKSMKDLMQKIDWMEQNLNILHQQNSDYHIELEAKESVNVQLTKQLSHKQKIIIDLKTYENHLLKRLTKTQELLENANKLILTQEMKMLSKEYEKRKQHNVQEEEEEVKEKEKEKGDDQVQDNEKKMKEKRERKMRINLRTIKQALTKEEGLNLPKILEQPEFAQIWNFFDQNKALVTIP